MTGQISRRDILRSAAAITATAPLLGRAGAVLAADTGLKLGPAQPFGFDALAARAQAMAAKPYQPPYRPAPEIVSKIDYETHGKIRFRTNAAPFSDGSGIYPATFFHLGQFFQKSVKMHLLEGGAAREILYSPAYFDMPADSIARRLPADSGFAGFRFQESRLREDWRTQDWIAFLGASYFRAIGALGQYGLSARGIAVDVAAPTPEEFPDFTEFYLAPAKAEGDPAMVYALLDGPSISGAFRFAIRRGEGVVMDVENRLFLRRDIHRLGIAPLTSMFWTSEYNRGFQVDWRPEVHDSDGLALWTGAGERIWRPLNNPRRVVTSSFVDEDPHGFGLLQRDRDFEHYLDGVNYDKRPSLWVEPLGDWGAGSVQLVEIPTDDEIHDNIVAFWVPKNPATAGSSYNFGYRLHWLADEAYPDPNIARTVASRIGRGGEPGKPRPAGVTKFVVEFEGKVLEALPKDAKPKPVVNVSRGEVSLAFAEPVPGRKRWRASFDVTAPGPEPVEIRLYLQEGGRPLTETWLYQHLPIAD